MTQEKTYSEALRYFQNANDILRSKANKHGRFYEDVKYVRMACATAYNGVLLALNYWLKAKGKPVEKTRRKGISVLNYQENLAQLDKKLLNEFNNVYNVLHLDGYYDGINVYDTISAGMNSAKIIIEKIKPRVN